MATGVVHKSKGTNSLCGSFTAYSRRNGHIIMSDDWADVTCVRCLGARVKTSTPVKSTQSQVFTYRENGYTFVAPHGTVSVVVSKGGKEIDTYESRMVITSKASLSFSAFDWLNSREGSQVEGFSDLVAEAVSNLFLGRRIRVEIDGKVTYFHDDSNGKVDAWEFSDPARQQGKKVKLSYVKESASTPDVVVLIDMEYGDGRFRVYENGVDRSEIRGWDGVQRWLNDHSFDEAWVLFQRNARPWGYFTIQAGNFTGERLRIPAGDIHPDAQPFIQTR